MKLQNTTRYSQFKTIRGNRDINVRYLTQLMRSIQDHNMLEQNPIMVNERMEVLDGQHRLKAAEILEIPIYYLVVPTGSLREIQLLNTHQRRWTMGNFLESYVERGKKDYEYLKEFIDRTGVSLSIAMMLLSSSNRKGELLSTFMEGEFKATNKEFAQEIVDRLRELSKYTLDSAELDREFVTALVRLYRAGIKHETLIDKFGQSHMRVGRYANAKGYIRALEDVLSYRKRATIKIES